MIYFELIQSHPPSSSVILHTPEEIKYLFCNYISYQPFDQSRLRLDDYISEFLNDFCKISDFDRNLMKKEIKDAIDSEKSGFKMLFGVN